METEVIPDIYTLEDLTEKMGGIARLANAVEWLRTDIRTRYLANREVSNDCLRAAVHASVVDENFSGLQVLLNTYTRLRMLGEMRQAAFLFTFASETKVNAEAVTRSYRGVRILEQTKRYKMEFMAQMLRTPFEVSAAEAVRCLDEQRERTTDLSAIRSLFEARGRLSLVLDRARERRDLIKEMEDKIKARNETGTT